MTIMGIGLSSGAPFDMATETGSRVLGATWGEAASGQSVAVVKYLVDTDGIHGYVYEAYAYGFTRYAQPASDDEWNPAFTRLTYEWYGLDGSDGVEGADGQTFDNLRADLPARFRDASIAQGPAVSGVFLPGRTYSGMTLRVFDHANGVKTEEVVVNLDPVTTPDPDTIFGDALTIYVDPDGTYAGVPGGVPTANKVTSFADAITQQKTLSGGFGRILFRAGVNHACDNVNISTGLGQLYLDRYGAGTNPVLDATASTVGLYSIYTTFTGSYVAICNVDALGPWNPDTETGEQVTGLALDNNGYGVMYNCSALGFDTCFGLLKKNNYDQVKVFSKITSANHSNFGAYSVSCYDLTNNTGAILGVSGYSAKQSLNALMGAGGKNDDVRDGNKHGSFRIQNVQLVVSRCWDSFCRNDWDQTKNYPPAINSNYRMHSNHPRTKHCGERMWMEGGTCYSDGSATNTNNGSGPANGHYRDLVVVGSVMGGGKLLNSRMGGAFFYNIYGVIPNAPSPNDKRNSILIQHNSINMDAASEAWPWGVVGATLAFMLDDTNLDGSAPTLYVVNDDVAPVTGTVQESLLLYAPNYTAEQDTTALPADIGTYVAPQFLGLRYQGYTLNNGTVIPDLLTMDGTYATPSATPTYIIPQTAAQSGTTDSGAIGAALGEEQPWRDILGNVRTTGTLGAFEPVA